MEHRRMSIKRLTFVAAGILLCVLAMALYARDDKPKVAESKSTTMTVPIPLDRAKELQEALGAAQYVSGVVNYIKSELGKDECQQCTVRALQLRAEGYSSNYLAKLREIQGDLLAAKHPDWKEWAYDATAGTLVAPKPKTP
jgi:hypothetical protein